MCPTDRPALAKGRCKRLQGLSAYKASPHCSHAAMLPLLPFRVHAAMAAAASIQTVCFDVVLTSGLSHIFVTNNSACLAQEAHPPAFKPDHEAMCRIPDQGFHELQLHCRGGVLVCCHSEQRDAVTDAGCTECLGSPGHPVRGVLSHTQL